MYGRRTHFPVGHTETMGLGSTGNPSHKLSESWLNEAHSSSIGTLSHISSHCLWLQRCCKYAGWIRVGEPAHPLCPQAHAALSAAFRNAKDFELDGDGRLENAGHMSAVTERLVNILPRSPVSPSSGSPRGMSTT